MGGITIGQIWQFAVVGAAGAGSIIGMIEYIKKAIRNKKKTEDEELMAEITRNFEVLKKQNEELKDQLVAIMKLTTAITTELQTIGHVNGRTAEAFEELQELLFQK